MSIAVINRDVNLSTIYSLGVISSHTPRLNLNGSMNEYELNVCPNAVPHLVSVRSFLFAVGHSALECYQAL